MDIKELIGKNIKMRRTELKLSQEQLGELINCDKMYISKIENGHVNISIEYLQKIADALKCHINEFLK